jgi:hypothetical protein
MIDHMNSPSLAHRLAFGLIRGGAVTVEVFLHRRMGIRYVTGFGSLGILIMSAYFALLPLNHAGPFFIYMLAFGVTWLLTIVETWLRFWRRDSEHSLFRGFPRLLRRELAYKEYRAKQFGEPVLVGCAGYFAFQWNGPLGVYWMFAAACLFLSSAAERRWETRDAMMLHDAALEQQNRARRFREIHGVRDI